LWLFAAFAPCVMAGDHQCARSDNGKEPCALTANVQCGLAAVDCRLPDPNPPNDIAVDPPAPVAVVLATLPVVEPLMPARWRQWTRAGVEPSPASPPLENIRLLI
jgi:hypothetical protein